MKGTTTRFTSILTCIAVIGLFWLSACHPTTPPPPPPVDGKIPVNPEKALEHIITAAQGHEYIHSFSTAKMELARQLKDTLFLDHQFQLPVAESFNRDAIASLLNADGADGIRIYLGRDSSGQIRLVLVPINKRNQDILTTLVTAPTDTAGGPKPKAMIEMQQMVEIGQRCPTVCDTPGKG